GKQSESAGNLERLDPFPVDICDITDDDQNKIGYPRRRQQFQRSHQGGDPIVAHPRGENFQNAVKQTEEKAGIFKNNETTDICDQSDPVGCCFGKKSVSSRAIL
ncbi:MAG: hypothetical protein IJ873_08445, partial [Lachnospiraceae bacterium]|nr:hypothetical protein [Lachnospiraceae bacterium]